MRVVGGNRENVVVEFADLGGLRRVWMPRGEELTVENCRRGIDVGITAEDIEELGLVVDAERLLHGLHRRGIWTGADLQGTRGMQSARHALMEGLGWALAQLMNLISDRR